MRPPLTILSLPECQLVESMEVKIDHVHPYDPEDPWPIYTPDEKQYWENIKRIDRKTDFQHKDHKCSLELFPRSSMRDTMLQICTGQLIVLSMIVHKVTCKAGLVFRDEEVAHYFFDWHGTHRTAEMSRSFDRQRRHIHVDTATPQVFSAEFHD